MRINEYQNIVNTLTLESIEMNHGHILSRHDKMTDSDLIDRCARLKKSCATTFECERDTVLKMIQDTLVDKEFQTPECVIEWLEDDSDGGLFIAEKEYDKVVGRGFFREKWHEWELGAIACHGVIVVLKKVERKYDTSFKVVTAYPSLTEKDIDNFKKMSA